MKEIKKVACYYRVSTSDQKDRGTIENQWHRCREYCQQKGWEIIAEFEDAAVSGTAPIDERPQGRLLMQRVKKKEFDAVVAVHLDRLTRSEKMAERGYIYDTLGEHDTAFASPSEGIIHCNDLVGDITYSLRSAIAKDEREKILERQQAGRYRASREGRYSAGSWNFGMVWVSFKDRPKEGCWQVNEAELATLKEATRLIKAGVSTTQIARMFNADLEKYPAKYAAKWTDGNIAAKFRSHFLFTGERTFKVGPDQFENHKIVEEPFFTKEEVMEIRHLLSLRKRGGPRRDKEARQANFLLAGIGYCECGGKLYTQDFTPQGKPYTYYRCKDCTLRKNSKEVDKLSWKVYTETLSNPHALRQAVIKEDFIVNKTTSDLKKLRDSCDKRLRELEGELERLNELYIRGKMKDEQYEKLSSELETEQAKVDSDYRRAVITLNKPKEADEALRRASEFIVKLAEDDRCMELIAEIQEREKEIREEAEGKGEEAELEALLISLKTLKGLRKVMKSLNKGLEELTRELEKSDPEAIRKELFNIRRKLFSDLVMAGGEIKVSHHKVVIKGLIRLGKDDFKEDILGQSRFG